LRHPDRAFAHALGASAMRRGWHATVPVHLFAARGDDIVALTNRRHCLEALRAAGSRGWLTDVGAVDHNHSAFCAVPRGTQLFTRAVRRQRPAEGGRPTGDERERTCFLADANNSKVRGALQPRAT
jgi:hypothetical protein